MKFLNKQCRRDGREGGRESRYKLPRPGRLEGDPGLTTLHIVVRLFVDCTKVTLSYQAQVTLQHTLSLFDLVSRFLAGPPFLGVRTRYPLL